MTTHCKRKRLSSSAASVIGSNDDLLIELLVFVPAKSLIRFQLVSKQWQSIISSSSFHRLHTLRFRHANYSKPQPSFILRLVRGTRHFICNLTTKTLTRFRFEPLNSRYHSIKVLRSRNGLLLLEARLPSRCGNHYLVFNPTTMQSRNLNLDKPFHRLFLVFDPHQSPYYRVLCFVKYRLNILFTKVYDSETHEWSKVIETESNLKRDQVCHAVYWKNGIYFTRFFLVCRVFRPEDGSVDRIGVPPVHQYWTREHSFHESNGHIYYVGISLPLPDRQLMMYVKVLSEDDLCWSNNLYVGCLDSILESHFGEFKIGVLGLISGANLIDPIVVFHVPGKIMMYSFVTETFEMVVDVGIQSYFKKDQLQFHPNDVHQLIHTLSPV